jgi:hypothetical protein
MGIRDGVFRLTPVKQRSDKLATHGNSALGGFQLGNSALFSQQFQ